MGRKHMAMGALFALGTALVACGGGASSLSEDDFIDELNDLCSDVRDDLEDIDIPDRQDFREVEDFAEEAIEILEDGIASLEEIAPPSDLEDDYDDLIAAAEDQLAAAQDLAEAAADEDQDAVDDAFADLFSSNADFADVGADLDADDCSVGTEEPSTTDAPTTDPSVPETTDGTVPPTTVPATTGTTAPPVTEPVVTMPVNTEPPMTMPSVTSGPTGSVTELDIVGFFAPPPGYTFEASSQFVEYVDSIANDPALGPVSSALGVVNVIDGSGNVAGELWILFTSDGYQLGADEDAGLAWLNWVGEGEVSFSDYVTAAGTVGYLSDFGNGNVAFGTIAGPFGIGLYGTSSLDVDGIIDGLFAANA